jgi:hypothetical protein
MKIWFTGPVPWMAQLGKFQDRHFKNRNLARVAFLKTIVSKVLCSEKFCDVSTVPLSDRRFATSDHEYCSPPFSNRGNPCGMCPGCLHLRPRSYPKDLPKPHWLGLQECIADIGTVAPPRS